MHKHHNNIFPMNIKIISLSSIFFKCPTKMSRVSCIDFYSGWQVCELTPPEISILSKVCKKFACKMMSHRWSGATYEDLLTITNLPTLERRRRLELKLCHLFNVEKGHIIIFVHPMTITCPNLLPELTLIFIHLYLIPFLSGTDSPLM